MTTGGRVVAVRKSFGRVGLHPVRTMPILNERHIVTSSGHSLEATVTDDELEDDELDGLRARLGAREGVCWLRLDEAVAELSSLHSVSVEEILRRVRAMIESERFVFDIDRS